MGFRPGLETFYWVKWKAEDTSTGWS